MRGGNQSVLQEDPTNMPVIVSFIHYSSLLLFTGFFLSVISVIIITIKIWPLLQQNTTVFTLNDNYMGSSVTSCRSIEFNDTRHNFSQMPDVLSTISCVHSVPKF